MVVMRWVPALELLMVHLLDWLGVESILGSIEVGNLARLAI